MNAAVEIPAHYPTLAPAQRRLVREEYVKRQRGLCAHCGQPLDKNPARHVLDKKLNMRLFPTTFLHWPVHLHHDHRTGETIGAVHARCNGVLWQYHGE